MSTVPFKNKMITQLTLDEGKVKHAYQDHLGYWTIGVGRLIDKEKGGGLSDEEIDYLLSNDIEKKYTELIKALPWVAQLHEARQAVLLNMAFQMGVSGLLKFTNTLQNIKNGKWDDASKGMLQSLWARQTPNRALKMAEQMRLGMWK